MKRRELLLATASLSLVGIPGASGGQSGDQTDPIRVEDVSVELGGATLTVGSAALSYEDGAAVFRGDEWTATSGSRAVTLGGAVVAVGEVDARTYGRIRSAMVDSANHRSLSPLLAGLAEADLDPDSPVTVEVGPVVTDGERVVDELTATGTVGGMVPENASDVASGAPLSELGTAEFDAVTVRRGGVSASGEDVEAEPGEGEVLVTADSGTAELPERTLDLHDIDAAFRPPEGGFPEAHRNAVAGLRRLAADGSLSASAIGATLAESGATVANTVAALGSVRVDATLGDVTEGGVSLVSDFEMTGTLAELIPTLRRDDSSEELDRMVIVRHRDAENVDEPDDYVDYALEVTGDLEKLEPDEDVDFARDRVSDRGDRVRVDGTVGTGDDRFAFSGELVEIDVPPEVEIEVCQR